MRATAEIYRVLKLGPKALLHVPLDAGPKVTTEFRKPNPDEYFLYRWYGLDYVERLTTAGLIVDVNLLYATLSEP